MKTTSITVERNFHILNDDRFIMEKISITAEIQDTDNVQVAIDNARDVIVSNFKKAYPHVEEHLNFNVVRQQVSESWLGKNMEVQNEKFIKNGVDAIMQGSPTETTEKINKGTIEEQIEACKTKEELESFRLIAFMNPKLKGIWQLKEEQIERIEINKQTV